MNDRQQFALANVLQRADDYETIIKLTRDNITPGGNIMRVILAIDK